MRPSESAAARHRADVRLLGALAGGHSITHAAEIAGVSRATATRRLNDQTFRARLLAVGDEALMATAAALSTATGSAVRALAATLEDIEAPAATRVAAARVLLDAACRFAEIAAARHQEEALRTADPEQQRKQVKELIQRIESLRVASEVDGAAYQPPTSGCAVPTASSPMSERERPS